MDYAWLDLETTGLNPKGCRIIEVAVVLTKDDFVPYDVYQSLVYQNPHVGWDGVAKEMHQKTGLYELVHFKGVDERHVIKDLVTFFTRNLDRRQVNLAGNSIHFDRSFIAEQWPELMPFLTHRHLDVSSFKILAEGRGVKKFTDNPPAHRAMDDVQNSVRELEYYLAELKKLP